MKLLIKHPLFKIILLTMQINEIKFLTLNN